MSNSSLALIEDWCGSDVIVSRKLPFAVLASKIISDFSKSCAK